ncbi:hypothetical protein GCM10009799_33580 [Nocardiopsis rhodophaea]|uniref:DUF397 domain-containing protein n=1 Tax=Nocardiopsis rhodophaea TaxID=280238 RepID=A0ABN2TBP5_9ACTN
MLTRYLTEAVSPAAREWHTSTYTQEKGTCVEVTEGPVTGLRDSMNRHLGALFFASAEWHSFIAGVKNDEL